MTENSEALSVVYMAHPVSGDVENNLAEARLWVRYLEENHPVAIVASWITECEVWDDANPEQRAAGFRRDFAVLAKCDELWLVGPKISTGMEMEKTFAEAQGIPVTDLTGELRLPALPCKVPPQGWLCSRGAGHDGPCAATRDPSAKDEHGHFKACYSQGCMATKCGTSTPPPLRSPFDEGPR